MVQEKTRKETNAMSDKQKKILEMFNKIIPDLTERDQDRMLSFGEGVAFIIGQNTYAQDTGQQARA